MLSGCVLISFGGLLAYQHDVLLEAKAACFLSTDNIFNNIYRQGVGIYGAELTCRAYHHLYAFVSADFSSKKGEILNFCSPHKATTVNLGVGLKYLFPFCYGDFYLGLGALPTHMHTKKCSPCVKLNYSRWGCGGIAKMGAFFNVAPHLLLDVYFDYSFVKMPFSSRHVNMDGCWFGAALGYRFN